MKLTKLISAALAILLVGCGTKIIDPRDQPDVVNRAPTTISKATYLIGVDDVLQVSVWDNPQLSVTVPVRPDGMISVPLIGDVKAGGSAPEQVATLIESQLATYVRTPKVTVIVSDLRSHEFLFRVRITGAVRQPRSMPFRQGMTVLDAVLESGGVNEFASANRSMLHRRNGAKTEVYSIRLGDIMEKGDLSSNMVLQPGDVLTVPQRVF